MIVCIAEKPSVARDIARILGATSARDGYMEGNGYQVTWTFGHLCELKEPNDYEQNWRYWTLAALPMVPRRFGLKLIPDRGIEKQFQTIASLYASADEIINCGDAGQEGELIQRWVMQMAHVKCPVKRLWISSMTDEAIREGFANLKEEKQYERLYLAGLSRAIGDWLLGMNCTRLYTLMYRQQRGQVLSIGRVQTPTLALLVKRQKEIDNFKPEPYWMLSTIYRDTLFTATSGKFTSKEEGEKAFTLIEGKPFEIVSVQKKQGREPAKQLYDLTSMQVDLNRKYGFSAEMSLNLIQSLYEKKLTTYPRVDTQYLSDDIYPKCPAILNGVSQYAVTGHKPYLGMIKDLAALGKTLPKSKRVFDTSKVTDHHAIIPTGQVPVGLTDVEKKVYDLIARRFIAVFYPDCKFSTTSVTGKVGKVEFKASGKEILSPGWRAVYSKEEQRADEGKSSADDKLLPTFVKGESGTHKPTLAEKMTMPPKHYTEASLLRAMETAGKLVDDEELSAAMKENGIGRPSSRAGIIETLFKRHYIRREKKNLVATPTGIQLIDTIHERLLTSVELTGIWEKKLREIEQGKYDAATFINELKEQVARIVNDVLHDNSGRSIVLSDAKAPKRESGRAKTLQKVKAGDVCPKCQQGHIIKGKTAYGCSRWKEGCDFRAPL
ncbi:DNA topoisomerase III [Hallella multisaccharivorax DSM 17128]|uniref:DNA topoisomerase n=1 Tax=Hallella multisaccharivorax DSM 17128 TaxID=688246 RepID=F8NA74_9BACT|nr:DNA topoisomerase 3 [Hallella multisaccharivorax]EGN56737.1 DNA topoisomerase III [Hallella multisaccharivorax DSM 17128]GJG30272.1 DNA topoisomerase III [Hallella multisaccharivorax DSM 17128]